METFNDKISVWLNAQRLLFSENDIQENLLNLPDILKDSNAMDENLELLEYLCKQFLKLSFIIAKHPKEIDKLVQYLED